MKTQKLSKGRKAGKFPVRKSPSRRGSNKAKNTKRNCLGFGGTDSAEGGTIPIKPPESTIEVFDFDTNWHLIMPHLRKPEVQKLLTDGMNDYLFQRETMRLIRFRDAKKCHLDIKYDPDLGPAHYDTTDSLAAEINETVNQAMAKAIGRGEFEWDSEKKHTQKDWDRYYAYAERFEPAIKGTYRFYRIHGACHFTVAWQQALGQCAFPRYTWKAMSGPAHSIAYGIDEIGNIKVIFDIFNFNKMSAIELIAFASQKNQGLPDAGRSRENATIA